MWKPSGSSEASMNVWLRAASSSTGLQGVEAFYKVPAEGAQWGLLSDLTQPAAQGTASQNRPMGLLRIAKFTPSLIVYVAMGKYFEKPVASLRDTKHFTAGYCQQTLCIKDLVVSSLCASSAMQIRFLIARTMRSLCLQTLAATPGSASRQVPLSGVILRMSSM